MRQDQVSMWHRLDEERSRLEQTVRGGQQLVEPNEEERRNGWTAETLTDYLAERTAAQSLVSDPTSLYRKSAARPRFQNNRYNPLRWRR